MSFGKTYNINAILNDLTNHFQDTIAYININEYKMPKTFVDNRISNNITSFHYNVLSCFYNDSKNMEMIEVYEKENNINFDIICKTRSELFLLNDTIEFIVDDPNDLIIRNKHMQNIRHWGHLYNDTPLMISDAFAYGNKKV